ncbi:MAG: DNA-formamidopyrimidine glycosylase [Candidatus Melainabacteria bacterium]|nr:DNA-formamidopyrimidine glycosylase [Candidatus Melainabacteria bacterium]
MPELPEVETVARGLNEFLQGEVVRSVEVLRVDSVGYPEVSQFKKLLRGHSFGSARRRGKYIVVSLSENASLVVHLRMSGRLVLKEKSVTAKQLALLEKTNFVRIRMVLESGRELHYEDMRVFGRIWYVPAGTAVEKIVTGIASLGVEPLTDLTVDYLVEAFRGKNQPIKNTLLDQTIIAGIGNIYADESLFLAGINPLQPAGKLKREQISVLRDKIISVLTRSIELGGTTLRDYQNLTGVNGDYQNAAMVYGREAEGCHQCGSSIERLKLAGRSSHFCPRCQPVSNTLRRAHEAAAQALKDARSEPSAKATMKVSLRKSKVGSAKASQGPTGLMNTTSRKKGPTGKMNTAGANEGPTGKMNKRMEGKADTR